MSTERRRRFRVDPVAVADRLGRYRRGAGAPTSEGARLRAAWREAVGDQTARNSIPVRRSRPGVVTVACASAAWAQELSLHSERYLRALRAALPDEPLAGLRFVVGDHVMPGAEKPERPKPVVPTTAELKEAEAAGMHVSDPELRDRVIRAAAGQLALARARRKDLQKAKKPGRVGRGG